MDGSGEGGGCGLGSGIFGLGCMRRAFLWFAFLIVGY